MGFIIGSLSESSLSEFTNFLDSAKNGSTDEPPYHLLQGDDNVTPIQFSNGHVEVSRDIKISSRMDLGRYLSDLIHTREDLSKVLDDKGAGAFLAIVFFHRICTRNDDETWNVKATDRYIPNLRQRTRFYRHLVQSPLSVYKLHGEMGRLYLCQPVSQHPDTMEQMASREELVLNPNIIKMADRLYWDEDEQYVKETTANIDPLPNGALRRFVGPGSFCEQYGAVYDFWSMDANALTRILPLEFNEWLD